MPRPLERIKTSGRRHDDRMKKMIRLGLGDRELVALDVLQSVVGQRLADAQADAVIEGLQPGGSVMLPFPYIA